MSKTIDLEQIPVIKELVEAAIDEKTTPLEDEIEDIKKNGDRVHRFLLYDWDDTLIGVVAVPMGYDPRPYINKYVKENLIHPQLRNQTAAQIASRERTDNYRGEYPHTGPDPDDPLRTGGADTVPDGGEYPLTNHLEYCFMGKDIDPDYPYVSGWTEVTAENMADTFTALTTNSDGTVPATEFAPAPAEGETAPRIVQYGWTEVASVTTPMVVRLKACYKAGTHMSTGYWALSPKIESKFLTSINIADYRIGICIKFIRIGYQTTASGYGMQHSNAPALRYTVVFDNEMSTTFRYDPDNRDVLLCKLDLQAENLTRIKYKLVETRSNMYDYSIISAPHLSEEYEIDIPSIVYELKYKLFQEEQYNFAAGLSTVNSFTYQDLNEFGYRYTNGEPFTKPANWTLARGYIKKFITAGIAVGQTDPYSYTYYQYQYAIMTKGTGSGNDDIVYLTPAEAEEYCKANYEWCKDDTTE